MNWILLIKASPFILKEGTQPSVSKGLEELFFYECLLIITYYIQTIELLEYYVHYLPTIILAKIRTCNQKHKKPLHLTRIFTSKELFNKIGNSWSIIEYASSLLEGN